MARTARGEHRPALPAIPAWSCSTSTGPRAGLSLEQLEWELGELPPTRLQISGRGEHRFYATPEVDSIGNSTAPLGNPSGLDLRAGSRGYVVTAPSLHASGVHYEWLDPERPIETLPLPWTERLLARPAATGRNPKPASQWGLPPGRLNTLWACCSRTRAGQDPLGRRGRS